MKEEDQESINGVDPTIKFGGVVGPFITNTEVDQRGKGCEIEFSIKRSEVGRMMLDGRLVDLGASWGLHIPPGSNRDPFAAKHIAASLFLIRTWKAMELVDVATGQSTARSDERVNGIGDRLSAIQPRQP